MDKEQGTNPHQQSNSAEFGIERNWTQQQGKTAPYGKEQGVTYPPWYQQRNHAQQQGKTHSYGKEQGVTYPPWYQQRNYAQQLVKSVYYSKEQGVTYAPWHQQLNFATKIQGFFRKIGSECSYCLYIQYININAHHAPSSHI